MKPKPLTKTFFIPFLCLAVTLAVSTSSVRADLELLEQPVLTVDSSNNASGLIYFLKKPLVASNPVLSIGPVISDITGNVLPVQVDLNNTGHNIAEITNLPTGVPGDDTLRQVSLKISGFSADGMAHASLLAGNEVITNLLIRRLTAPFNISLENTPAGSPEVLFAGNNPGALLLRNADAISYHVNWSLEINNRIFTNGETTLPAASSFELGVPSPDFDSCCTLCSYLKDTVLPARLILQWGPGTGDSATNLLRKNFPVRLRLHDDSDCHQIVGYVIILFLLTLGGMASLLANNGIPNQLRRLDLREQLLTMGRRVHNLTAQLDSSLRVQMRMEARRLRIMLGAHVLISPELATVFTQVSTGATTLNRQINLLEKMDALYDRLDAESALVPPTQIIQYKQKLKQAGNLLRATPPPEADLQKAEILIAEASAILDNLGKPDTDLAKSLTNRIIQLKKRFDAATRAKVVAPINPDLLNVLPQPADPDPKPESVLPETYTPLDSRLFKLEMIADYFSLPPDILSADATSAIGKARVEWLQNINLDGPAALAHTRRLLEQLKQGIFLEDLVTLLKDKAPEDRPVDIELGQPVVYVNDPEQMSIAFHDSKYNSPITRELLTCIWDFGDGLKEKGWTVYHYFPKPGSYPLKVKFITADGKELEGPETDLKVRETETKWYLMNDRTVVELLRFGIALGAVLLALISGAQAQIAKLDCLPGLLAVLLMGFGADTIKNLLSQKTQ